MTLSMYDVTVPVFARMLTNLLSFLDKAEADATARKYPTEVLADARLSPDMLPLKAQIMTATDHVKGCVSRLAGNPVPSWPDEEKTFDELRVRVRKALDLLATITPEALAGSESRDVTIKRRSGDVTLNALDYVNHAAMPNFYFHVTTAYAILRANGVPLGKSDFIG